MNLKNLTFGLAVSFSLAAPASLAHGVVAIDHGHDRISAVYCPEDSSGSEFFNEGGFSRVVSSHGVNWAGGVPNEDNDGDDGVAFRIDSDNLVTADWFATGTGSFSPFVTWFYLPQGSSSESFGIGGVTVSDPNSHGVRHWSFRKPSSLGRFDRVVELFFGDFGDGYGFTDNASGIFANSHPPVPTRGLQQDCDFSGSSS